MKPDDVSGSCVSSCQQVSADDDEVIATPIRIGAVLERKDEIESVRRARRRVGTKPRTMSTSDLLKSEQMRADRQSNVIASVRATIFAERPTTRGACSEAERPCPWVGCRHHLYLSVNEDTGSITFTFPDLEPHQLTHSCSLDVADRGGLTLEDVAEKMNLTRERIRQIEVRAARLMRADAVLSDLASEDE